MNAGKSCSGSKENDTGSTVSDSKRESSLTTSHVAVQVEIANASADELSPPTTDITNATSPESKCPHSPVKRIQENAPRKMFYFE